MVYDRIWCRRADRADQLSAQAYAAFGSDRKSISPAATRPSAILLRSRTVYDMKLLRFRGSVCSRAGDSAPFDNRENRLRRDFREPIFAGGIPEWIRQTIPLPAAGEQVRSMGGTEIDSLRSSRRRAVEFQQSGDDPGWNRRRRGHHSRFRLSVNANHLWFHKTAVLQALRKTRAASRIRSASTFRGGDLPTEIHAELGVQVLGRRAYPGQRISRIFSPTATAANSYYSVLFNAILTY